MLRLVLKRCRTLSFVPIDSAMLQWGWYLRKMVLGHFFRVDVGNAPVYTCLPSNVPTIWYKAETKSDEMSSSQFGSYPPLTTTSVSNPFETGQRVPPMPGWAHTADVNRKNSKTKERAQFDSPVLQLSLQDARGQEAEKCPERASAPAWPITDPDPSAQGC